MFSFAVPSVTRGVVDVDGSLLLLVKFVLFVEYDLLFVVYCLLCVACPYTLRRNHLSRRSICFILSL